MRVLRHQVKRISTGGRKPRVQLASKGPTRRSNSPSSDSNEFESFETVEVRRISTGGMKPRKLLASKGSRRIISHSSEDTESRSVGRISTGGRAPRIQLASKGPRHISRSPSPQFLESYSLQLYRPGTEVKPYIRKYQKSCYTDSSNSTVSNANRTKGNVSVDDIKLARRIRGDYNYFYL